jgi:hypothetical protein
MSIEGNSELQLCLVNAVKNQAPLEVISTLLRNGADAGNLDFLQSLEDIDVHSAQATAWSERVRALPLVVTALNWRAIMDQAAFDLVDAIEANDFQDVQSSLETLVDGGEDANFDMGEGSMLALAVRHRCDLEIIKLMLTKGYADVGGFCADALEALDEAEEEAWAAAVTGLLEG